MDDQRKTIPALVNNEVRTLRSALQLEGERVAKYEQLSFATSAELKEAHKQLESEVQRLHMQGSLDTSRLQSTELAVNTLGDLLLSVTHTLQDKNAITFSGLDHLAQAADQRMWPLRARCGSRSPGRMSLSSGVRDACGAGRLDIAARNQTAAGTGAEAGDAGVAQGFTSPVRPVERDGAPLRGTSYPSLRSLTPSGSAVRAARLHGSLQHVGA